MPTNLDRLKKDISELKRRGDLLHVSMQYELDPEGMKQHFERVFTSGKISADEFIKKLPNFGREYEAWYSESLALLRQVLPERLENFRALYEKPKNRKSVEYGNYVIQDYLQGLIVTNPLGDTKVERSAAEPQLRQQLAMVAAAEGRFQSSLFEIKKIAQADLFDSELDAARELLKHKFLRAAGAVAGVVLEKHLRQVIEDHDIVLSKKHPSLGDLNEALKNASVIDVAEWRKISFLADIRNLCDHNKSKEPTEEQVSDLIEGAAKTVKNIA